MNFVQNTMSPAVSSHYLRRAYPMDCSGPSNVSMFVQDFRQDVEPNDSRDNNNGRRNAQDFPNENFRDRPKFSCLRTLSQQTYCRNFDIMDSFVTFNVDRDIFVLGIQVPSQIIPYQMLNVDCQNLVILLLKNNFY